MGLSTNSDNVSEVMTMLGRNASKAYAHRTLEHTDGYEEMCNFIDLVIW